MSVPIGVNPQKAVVRLFSAVLLVLPLAMIADSAAASGPLEIVSPTGPSAHDLRRGDAIEVEWGGHWYSATVLRSRGGETKIRYDGYGKQWDEWVDGARIRIPQLTEVATAKHVVEVEWGGTWWPASVLDQRGDAFLIRYAGYGAEWDEWVTQKRMRPSR